MSNISLECLSARSSVQQHRNPSWKPPCSISWHVWHISRMPQCTLIIQYVTCKAHGLFIFGKYLQDQNGSWNASHVAQSFRDNQHFAQPVISTATSFNMWKPPCSILWHVKHISRMPQCTLISTATSFNMSHARLMAYSSLASICKTKMASCLHETLLMLPNHFVITNILRNPSWKPPCSILWHVKHISRWNASHVAHSFQWSPHFAQPVTTIIMSNISLECLSARSSVIIQYVTCKAHGLFSFGTYLQDQNGSWNASHVAQSFRDNQHLFNFVTCQTYL